MQKVTIVIPNYNERRLLENCLKTLENQTYTDFKVLIIDNGSTDGSKEIISDTLDMEIVSLETNLGFCGAVNLGIQMTNTPYIILLNNDTETDRYFVETLLKAIERSEKIFSCGAQMIDFQNHKILDNAGDLYTAMGWAVARGKGKRCIDYEKKKRVFSCCAGAAIYRMDILNQIGGLDEHHFAYLEDVDLGYRARIHGFENWYIPEAKVYHVGSATTGARYNEKKVFLAARNTIFVIYKNMPFLQILLNFPFVFIGILIKMLFFIIKGYGRQYWKGIVEGVCNCNNCKKVMFSIKHIKNYVKIQFEIWKNMLLILWV